MPVQTESSLSGPYIPNGVTTAFAFDFKATAANEVVAVDQNGETISPALYSVTLDSDEGGTLSFASAPHLSDYSKIFVAGNPALTQPSDFDNAGPSFNPAALTRALDRAAARDLKQQRQIDSSIKLAFGETAQILPPAAQRVSTGGQPRIMGFDRTTGELSVLEGSDFRGGAGLAANTFANLIDFRAAPTLQFQVANLSRVPGIADGQFYFETGSAPYTVDNINVIKADDTPLSIGAWVRQGADKVAFQQDGLGAVTRTQQTKSREFVTPEDFGATGDGIGDDTVAVQRAFDTGRSVRLVGIYLISSKLIIASVSTGMSVFGQGRIKVSPAWDFAADTDGAGTYLRVIYVQSPFVSFEGISFDATGTTGGTAVENCFLWVTAPGMSVINCRFYAFPKATCIIGLGSAAYMSVTSCQFYDCVGAAFAKGRASIISNNLIVNAVDAAIAINGLSCVGAVVSGNTINNENLAPIPSMIAVEEGPSDWVITGNVLTGVNGGGIACLNVLDDTPVRGGIIANNIIDGANFAGVIPSNANPSALLSISPFYLEWEAHGNRILNCPAGNSNSRLAIISATGGSFHDNKINGTATAGLSAMVSITASTGGIQIRNNDTTAAAGVRHFLFSAGDYGDAQCTFQGGSFAGGAEAINSELSAGGIANFLLFIRDLDFVGAITVTNAATAIGDRSAFLNAGAWARPHRVGIFTDMYGNAVPASGGAIPFQNGDKIYRITPVPGSVGFVRVAGAWAEF